MKWIGIQNFILLNDITYAESIVLSAARIFENRDVHERKRLIAWLLREFMSRPTIHLSFKVLQNKQYLNQDFSVNYDRITPNIESNTEMIQFYPTQKC